MSTQDIQKTISRTMEQLPNRENIKRIRLFGSYLHQQATTQSDVDLLIEFEKPVGYFELVRLQDVFSHSLKRKVDLVTPNALSKYFRETVLKEAQALYEK